MHCWRCNAGSFAVQHCMFDMYVVCRVVDTLACVSVEGLGPPNRLLPVACCWQGLVRSRSRCPRSWMHCWRCDVL